MRHTLIFKSTLAIALLSTTITASHAAQTDDNKPQISGELFIADEVVPVDPEFETDPIDMLDLDAAPSVEASDENDWVLPTSPVVAEPMPVPDVQQTETAPPVPVETPVAPEMPESQQTLVEPVRDEASAFEAPTSSVGGFPSTDATPLRQQFGSGLAPSSMSTPASILSDSMGPVGSVTTENLNGWDNQSLADVQAEPFADQAEPFADQAEPFANQAEPFADQAEPFVMEDFGACQSPACGNGCDDGLVIGRSQKNHHDVFSVSGLTMSIDGGNDRALVAAPGVLNLSDTEHDGAGGIDAGFSRRKSNGRGWQLRYFGLFPSISTATSTPFPITQLAGLNDIGTPGGPTTADVFNVGDVHSVTRDTEIQNFEFNLLRRGRQYKTRRAGRCGRKEFVMGFRYFKFDESLNYASQSNNDSAIPGVTTPSRAAYINSVENSLAGFQLGGRNDLFLNQRWSLTMGLVGGIFNNSVDTRQRAEYTSRADGSISNPQILAGPNAGSAFDVSGSDDDVAFLGEVDFGVVYQLSPRCRTRLGYRAVGATEIARASDQINDDFSQIGDPDTDGDLILQGAYFGIELAR